MSKPTGMESIVPGEQNTFLAITAIATLIKHGFSKKESQERVTADQWSLRDTLGWESSSTVERLLIEAVVLNWVRVQHVDMLCSSNATKDGYRPGVVDHFERRLSICHRRYLDSLMALAKVRRLGINVQVNIGQNQLIGYAGRDAIAGGP